MQTTALKVVSGFKGGKVTEQTL